MRFSHLMAGGRARVPFIVLLVLLCALSGCTPGLPASTNAASTSGSSQSARGPIRLYDVHGVLLCELQGADAGNDCLAAKAGVRQFAGQFIDYAVSELGTDLHIQGVNSSSSAAEVAVKLPTTGLNVWTTLDLVLQKQVLHHTQQYIGTMATTHNMTNAAEVAIDYHSGAIRSFIGSLDPQVNVLTQNKRQAGEVFKPLVYATAFEHGISPGEVVYDGPFSVGQGLQSYAPYNYDRRFHGYLSYRAALQNSYNIPVLKLYVKMGFDELKKQVVALGIKPENIGTEGHYSLPLGTSEIPLLDATVAYGTMANGGVHLPPHAIEKVSTADSHVLFSNAPQGTQALSPQAAFMMTDVMSDNAARAAEFGPCSPLLLYTATQEQCYSGHPGTVRPAAVHGGTNGAFRDTVTIGYTADMVVGAWSGNSNASPMFNIIGMDGAARIWHDTMLLAEGQQQVRQFPGPPTGVVKKTVSYSGLTTTDWYTTT